VNTNFVRTALVLGLLSVIGPFAIDMYLPGLPSIGRVLHASDAQVDLSLMVFIMTVSISQLFYGPLSDIVGRKVPLYYGLTLFALASAGCALATNIEMLIFFRILQGFGACAGMVMPRAMVRDLFEGRDAVRMMGLLILVFSISPILAPLFGSFLVGALSWRAIFWVMSVAAALGLLLTRLQLKESRPPAARQGSSWRKAVSHYVKLLRDWHFLGLGVISGFAFGAFIIYLGNSSFVIIGHYGLSPTQYSLCFSLNAFAFVATGLINGGLVGRFSLMSVLRSAVAGVAVVMVALFGLFAAGVDSLAVMIALLFVGYACMGPIMPNAIVLALEHHGESAGTASALLGSVQMLISGGVMGLTSYFADGTPLPMLAGIAATAVCAFVVTFILLPTVRPVLTTPSDAAPK
jgi:DHA1 family bicyclomycin/chloramphenicol resistance-like MFS transporter